MTRTSRRDSDTLSLGAVLVAILAAFGCATAARSPEAPASLEAAPSRFATLGGNRVHYRSLGSGREAPVLIHGWSGNVNVWRFQAPELAKHARVIAIDLRGHGSSRPRSTTASPRDRATSCSSRSRKS
jgi:hypothetical protein